MMKRRRHNGSRILPARPKAGLGQHVSSLPGDYGIGDIADCSLLFIDQLVEMGMSVWQFLPTGPTAYGDSPYQPLSAFAGNENLIGVEPLLRAGLITAGDLDELRGLPRDAVDFGHLIPAKQAVLARAAGNFQARAGARMKAEFDAFLDRHLDTWLTDYAVYRIIKSLHGERPWTEWAPEYAHREPQALERIFRRHRDEIERIRIIQFLFDLQWSKLRAHAGKKGIRLFGDMPIYISLDSADAWAHPEILLIDDDGQLTHVAGVPPDYFSEDGQLWGNPLYDWKYHAENGFRWWIDRIEHATRLADMVRVDHFRGFESFWAVPFGEETARKGSWEPGPGDALFLAMEKAMGDLPIVAEDLGVITDEVDDLRLRHHIPGMVVLQFELGEKDFELDDVEVHSVCYTGTHDNDTTIGWFRGSNDDTRTAREIRQTRKNVLKLTGGSPKTIHTDLIRLAFGSQARLAIAPMQDFLGLGSEARLNIPGTTSNNWRWRMLEEQMTPVFRDSVRELVEAFTRC